MNGKAAKALRMTSEGVRAKFGTRTARTYRQMKRDWHTFSQKRRSMIRFEARGVMLTRKMERIKRRERPATGAV